MKRIICLSVVIVMVLFSFRAAARDYMFQAAPNAELYEGMMSFAGKFADDVKGTPLHRRVRAFARDCRKGYAKDTLAWIGKTFDFVTELKEEYPPVISDVRGTEMCGGLDQIIRRDMMLLLDFPFHCDERSEGVSIELKNRYERARNEFLSYWRVSFLRWLDSPRPAPGTIEFCKVYSSGYVFRTADHTLGIDIRWDGTFEESEKIGSALDVMVVTHPHDDHMSPLVLQAMTKRGKPLVMPSEDLRSNVVLTPSDATVFWTEGDHTEPVEVGPVTLRAAMGDQGPKVPCNVYYIEMDGWRIVAKGDNHPVEAERYLASLPRPDFTIVPVFSYVSRILSIEASSPADGVRTSYLLPCHENEYHHLVRGRVGYRYFYGSPDRSTINADNYPSDFPYILMDAGEVMSVSRD